MWTSTRRLMNPVVGRRGDQMMGRSGDVRVTSVIYVFKFNSETLNLLCQVTQVNYGSEQYSNLNNKN